MLRAQGFVNSYTGPEIRRGVNVISLLENVQACFSPTRYLRYMPQIYRLWLKESHVKQSHVKQSYFLAFTWISRKDINIASLSYVTVRSRIFYNPRNPAVVVLQCKRTPLCKDISPSTFTSLTKFQIDQSTSYFSLYRSWRGSSSWCS